MLVATQSTPTKAGQLVERVVADGVGGLAVVPQFDEDPIPAERLDETFEFATGGSRPVGRQRRRDRTLPTAGQDPRVSGQSVGEVVEREPGCTLLAGEVTLADHPGEPGVSVGPVGEHEQVRPTGVGCVRVGDEAGVDLGEGVALGTGEATERQTRGVQAAIEHRDLAAEHRRQADRLGCLGEADHAVEAVVVGDRQRVEPEAGGFGGELFGV